MHSHLAVQHLIRQVEADRSRPRDRKPGWLTEMIDELANLFEPISISGRVGFNCQWNNDHWDLQMYLGRVEMVGGVSDGLQKPLNFEFDVRMLMKYFTSVDRMTLTAIPDASADEESLRSAPAGLMISGLVADQQLVLTILEQAPMETAAAMQMRSNGKVIAGLDIDSLWD